MIFFSYFSWKYNANFFLCFSQIDILVNNAGRSQRALWTETDLEVDRQMLEINVISVLSLTKLVLPHMLDRKQGHIVCMSSLAGKMRKFLFYIPEK